MCIIVEVTGFAKAPRAPPFGNDSSDNDKPPSVQLNLSPFQPEHVRGVQVRLSITALLHFSLLLLITLNGPWSRVISDISKERQQSHVVTGTILLCMYGHTYSKSMDQPGKLPILHVVS